MSGTLEEVAELYQVVPEQFVSARNDLVRRLRSEGDKAGAAALAKLRRPPLTTWALNQVARHDGPLIEQLLAAGGELRAAMERALDGDAAGLRQAHAGDRAAMAAVIVAAGTRLAEGGYSLSDVMRQRMAATLRAAVVDPAVTELLRAARLEGDRDVPGFGIDAFGLPDSRPAADANKAEDPREKDVGQDAAAAGRREETRRLAAEAHQMEADADEQAKEAHHLAAHADELQAEADAARIQAEKARTRAQEARSRADEAQRKAEAARTRTEEARTRADEAAAAGD